MRYDLKQMLRDADRGGYAVPAFNFSDCWELMGILEAARELRAPVIASSNMQVVEVHGARLLGLLCRYYTECAQTPVVFHLDHAVDPARCRELMDCGYPSVMIDGSHDSLEENICKTQQVVAHAQSLGVCVEAEIGRIRGQNEESSYAGEAFLGTVDGAARLVRETGCDSLAVGLGNAHGFYCETPKLDFARLEEINAAIDTPLVLHGGTGIPEADITRAIGMGINKVNVGTELHFTYVDTLRRQMEAGPCKPNVFANMLPVAEAVKEPVRRWIRICMADGKA